MCYGKRFVFAALLVCIVFSAGALRADFGEWTESGVGINTLPGGDNNIVMTPDGFGGTIIAWLHMLDEQSGAVYHSIARVDAAGQVVWEQLDYYLGNWTDGWAWGGHAVVADGAGGAICAFQCSDYSDDIWVFQYDAVGTPTGVGVITLDPAQTDGLDIKAVTDGSGGVLVCWNPALSGINQGIFIARFDLGIQQGTPLWQAAACTAVSFKDDIEMIADGEGGAIIAWSESRPGVTNQLDIFAQKITGEGNIAPGWDADGEIVCCADGEQKYCTLATNGSGGAFITWLDYRDGYTDNDIYVQWIDHDAMQWIFEPICSGPLEVCTLGLCGAPKIISDGAGDAIIAWSDTRNGDHDIYLQGIDSGNSVKWTTNGEAVCTEEGMQGLGGFAPLASDGDGGAVIVWFDIRNTTDYDIYGMRIDSTGRLKWKEGGVPICTAQNDQRFPSCVSDGSTGVIISWVDARDEGVLGIASGDLYAQRIDSYFDLTFAASNVTHTYLGAPVGQDFLVGCPSGDFHALKVDIYLPDEDMYRDIEAFEIALEDPNGDVKFWGEINELTADYAATPENGYHTVVTHEYISGCGIPNQPGGAPGINIPVLFNGVEIGEASDVKIKSVDYNADSRVDVRDQRALNKTLGLELGDKFYNACFDFDGDNAVTSADEDIFMDHWNHMLWIPMLALPLEEPHRHMQEQDPSAFQLRGNYPNPFNPSTVIMFSIAADAHVTLSIYDVNGRLVKTLVDGFITKNDYSVTWDGSNDRGVSVASGVYFYTLKTGNTMESRKLMLLR